ncbi:MFS transporter [Vibrio vulnificus]|uniref:multidrug effflux MFS transporter n=1 Tax=Vibrio vulnificus TaxID=672 RepID=UPI0006AD56CE|nr:multidrug effflux MFS transporter [Vibrio vulnificus]KOR99376.1 MFS transporter [Vibrio vulnificus]HDY8063684.1 multidrug effflux MFS transporter [Vibrio vulnificus]HDY8067729.1 multidrug effflux MFS transporter [Vibrio vulnificus]
MKQIPSLWLMVLLLMLPQVVETIYSPALTAISVSFAVPEHIAAQTLSVYFSAFAFGVVCWGILCDRWGRRPTMLLGLILYAGASLLAIVTDSFAVLMIARILSAFGIAVGSIVTQTMLRDAFQGEELAKVFSLMGLGIAISPVLGMLLGGQLVSLGGYRSVFIALFVAAMAVFTLALARLPETQQKRTSTALLPLATKMVKDGEIWAAALLVALYNIALFAYYQLGGFAFVQLGHSAREFGYSGIVLGLATFCASYINKRLLARKVSQTTLLRFAATLFVLGSLGVFLCLNSIWFLLPMMSVVMAFGIAIPNVLSGALLHYREHAGSAGALFGLMYYLLIGFGLALAARVQHLGIVLVGCSLLILCVMHLSGRRTGRAVAMNN